MFQLFFMGGLFVNIDPYNNELPSEFFSYFSIFPVIMALYLYVLFGWFYSVAVGLQSQLPEGVKLNVNRFKIFFFIPVIYLLVIFIGMAVLFNSIDIDSGEPPFSFESAGIGVVIIIPLHLFSMFCIFHTMYFCAKTLKSVELGRMARSGDYIGEFFLFWFWFIGVWILQPRINKLAASTPDLGGQS